MKSGIKLEFDILAFVGVMNIAGCNYIGVITEAEVLGELNKSKIYKVSQVELVPFNEVRFFNIIVNIGKSKRY